MKRIAFGACVIVLIFSFSPSAQAGSIPITVSSDPLWTQTGHSPYGTLASPLNPSDTTVTISPAPNSEAFPTSNFEVDIYKSNCPTVWNCAAQERIRVSHKSGNTFTILARKQGGTNHADLNQPNGAWPAGSNVVKVLTGGSGLSAPYPAIESGTARFDVLGEYGSYGASQDLAGKNSAGVATRTSLPATYIPAVTYTPAAPYTHIATYTPDFGGSGETNSNLKGGGDSGRVTSVGLSLPTHADNEPSYVWDQGIPNGQRGQAIGPIELDNPNAFPRVIANDDPSLLSVGDGTDVSSEIPRLGFNDNSATNDWSNNPGYGKFTIDPIPEPAPFFLLGAGLLVVTLLMRRRFKK